MKPWYHEYEGERPFPTIRGTFLECPWSAKIKERRSIDKDVHGSTRQVIIDIKGTGVTYLPGDRLAVLPENSPSDVQDCLDTLGLSETTTVGLEGDWSRRDGPTR